MDTIANRIAAAKKDKLGVELTAKPWDPKDGDVLMGELVFREVIEKKENGKHYDKVTLRTDSGLVDTIIRSGILALAVPPIIPGDLLVITYNGLKSLGDGKRSMHDTSVKVYPVADRSIPF